MTIPAGRLLEEIQEQPERLGGLLKVFPDNFESLLLPNMYTHKLIGIGEGSSLHAFQMAAPFIEEFTGLNTFSFSPQSLLTKFDVAGWFDQPIKRLFRRSFFLPISQSGETASIASIVEQLQQTLGFADVHSPLVLFTNNTSGQLAQRFKNHVDVCAAEEQSIAATKSMTTSLLALLLFGVHCGQSRKWLKATSYQYILEQLRVIPEALQAFLSDESMHEAIKDFVEGMKEINHFVLLSSGPLTLMLPEAGLKLTETSRNTVWADNCESFKHGYKVMLYGVKGVHPNCVYVVPPNLSPQGETQFFSDVLSHFYTQGEDSPVFNTDNVFFIRFHNSAAIPKEVRERLQLSPSQVLTLPASDRLTSLFLGLTAFQLVSYYLALAKGEDPNHPALQKAVIR